MNKRGLILVNAYSKLKHALNQSIRLKEELEKFGVLIDIKRNNFFPCAIDKKGNTISNIYEYDFCIYLDKDKYVSTLLEHCGLRLFNSAKSIEVCDDKMVTFECLANKNIPMPLTLPGLLCYDKNAIIENNTLEKIEKTFSYPLVVKESYGSLGKGVYKVDNREELAIVIEKLKCHPHLFQEFIKSSEGKDIRVITIGKKYFAAMLRQSNTDFRSNLELGGQGTSFNADDELKSLCEKVSDILNLDYCGIDILFGPNGYLICEVNSNAFFGGIEKVTGKNVAKTYAEYIYSQIYKSELIV